VDEVRRILLLHLAEAVSDRTERAP
jgi:hypothetical protein